MATANVLWCPGTVLRALRVRWDRCLGTTVFSNGDYFDTRSQNDQTSACTSTKGIRLMRFLHDPDPIELLPPFLGGLDDPDGAAFDFYF